MSDTSLVAKIRAEIARAIPTWIIEMFMRTAVPTSLDFPSVASQGIQELTLAVPGALVGQTVTLAVPATLPAGLIPTGYVSAADIVTIRLTNITAAAIDPAAATWGARAL